MTTFDLNILPIHRLNGQDLADLPGLLALTPPRRTARGREKDSLILYLMLSGNTTFSTTELNTLNNKTANTFYQSAGTLTTAMRKAAESINTVLLERNLSTTGRGQYALGLLALGVIREDKCTLLLSGPTHAIWVGEGQSRHIHDPALSGKGLGSSQNIQSYLAQVDLHTHDLLVLCGKFPRDWEADLLGERPPTSLEATYRKLTFTKGDLNAAIIQPQLGQGIITVLHAEVSTLHQTQPFDAAPDKGKPVSSPQGAPVSQSVAPQEEVDSTQPAGDILIESPQGFRGDARNVQPSTFDYAASQTEPANSAENESPVSDSPVSITEEELDELADFAAHMLQPSAYAIPPQPPETLPPLPEEKSSRPSDSAPRSFPPSIPRVRAVEAPIESLPDEIEEVEEEEEIVDEEQAPVIKPSFLSGLRSLSLFGKPKDESKPNAHAVATRQMAKVMVSGIQSGRRVNERLEKFLRRFIPRLLPGVEGEPQQKMFIMPTYMLVFIAIVIPVLVSVISWVVFAKYGLNERYNELYQNALTANAQAGSETDPTRQRDELTKVIEFADQALDYQETDESKLLRSEAQTKLDALMGVARLEFIPAFTNGLNNTNQISRMAASESDLYMLDAERGNVLHATFTGRRLELDTTFNCQPGKFAGYQVGTLVDVLALPKINAFGATVLGIDATGNLLYCAPGQVPQALPLPSLPNTNWGRINGFTLDNGDLYVLDATGRAVWVFPGKDSAFVDAPYFYFGNQIPRIDNVIDMAVSGDDLYLLHADGHLSTCTFSRISETPTKCIDPVNFQDPFPAHQDLNLFAQAHFTQLSLTAPPNTVVLLLDSENRKVFRFTPRALELQNQITSHAGKANPFQSGSVGAMTVSPNYVLYLAIGNQVYFASNLP